MACWRSKTEIVGSICENAWLGKTDVKWHVMEAHEGACSLDGVLEKTLEDLQEITSLAETTAVVPPIYHVI